MLLKAANFGDFLNKADYVERVVASEVMEDMLVPAADAVIFILMTSPMHSAMHMQINRFFISSRPYTRRCLRTVEKLPRKPIPMPSVQRK